MNPPEIPTLFPPLGLPVEPQMAVTIEVQGKDWWKSKTVWFNVGAMGVELLQVVGTLGIVPPGTITTAVTVVNIFLRRLTTEPIKGKHPLMVAGILKTEGVLNVPIGGLPPWMLKK